MQHSMLKKIKAYIKALKLVNLKDSSRLIQPCDVLLFCHDVNRSITLKEQAYSPIMDSIKDEIEKEGFTCVSIAHPWSKIIGKRGYGEPIAMNRSYFLSLVLRELLIPLRIRPDLKLYEKIISKANPQAILTIGGNDELCEAARNLKVFHAEVLHGIGYRTLPWGWDKKEKASLPQGILSLDKTSTSTFSSLEKYGITVKEIAHPFLSRFQGENSEEIPHEWLPSKIKGKYKKEILISLQWGFYKGVDELEFAKGVLSNGLFYNELEEAIKKTSDTVYWRFRLHPVQQKQPRKYRRVIEFIEKFVNENDNCDWRESTYLPLPSILKTCSGHITMFSMSSYDAAYLGIPTLALCPSLRAGGIYEELLEDLVDSGHLTKQKADSSFILNWANRSERIEPFILEPSQNHKTQPLIKWLQLEK